MKRSAIIFTFLISLIGGITFYGYSLPERSHITLSQSFNRPTDYIWKLIYEYQHYPKWREDIYTVDKTPNSNQKITWKETNGKGITTPFKLINSKLNQFITIQETGDTHLSSGKWHFEVKASKDNKSTTLTITEDRLIPNMLSRAINHLLKTRTENIDSYFRSINNKIYSDEINAQKSNQHTPVQAE